MLFFYVQFSEIQSHTKIAPICSEVAPSWSGRHLSVVRGYKCFCKDVRSERFGCLPFKVSFQGRRTGVLLQAAEVATPPLQILFANKSDFFCLDWRKREVERRGVESMISSRCLAVHQLGMLEKLSLSFSLRLRASVSTWSAVDTAIDTKVGRCVAHSHQQVFQEQYIPIAYSIHCSCENQPSHPNIVGCTLREDATLLHNRPDPNIRLKTLGRRQSQLSVSFIPY